MPIPIRVLIVEDSPDDAELMLDNLADHGFASQAERVETEADYLAGLNAIPDVILADFRLPQFSVPRALELLDERRLDIPFIVLSGVIGDEEAAGLIKLGASDFLLKDRMARLGPVVTQALKLKVARDERCRLEAALAESEEKFRLICETATDAVVLLDGDNRIRYANPAIRNVFGYAPDEVEGKPIAILQPAPLREHHQQAVKRFLETGVKTQNRGSIERIGLHRDGHEFTVELSCSHMIMRGKPVFVGVIRDITERKQAENALRASEMRYRSLFDNMLEGFAYCRMLFENGRPRDWVYVEVNPAFEQLTGLKNVAGKKVTEVIPGIRESNPELIERYGRVASTGKPEVFETYVAPLEEWFSISAFCPEPGYFVAVFEMITDRKAAEQKVRDNADDLRTLSRKLLSVQENERRLLACELHDQFGQTLTALKINLQVMERQPAAVPIASTIAECVQIAGRALEQVRTLVLDLRPPQLDELGLAVALRAHAERQLTSAGVVLDFSAPDALAWMSREIEIACFRIAQEALTNIVRHAGARNVRIKLASGGGALCLAVSDDGRGFDYSATRVRAARGGSIGLLSMEERAALAGGRIEISTAPNAGTMLHAVFPLSAAQSQGSTA
ncbi:MAG: PAS domain S-box protein [Betaproteobacteria bacterium]|nr:PAS domain S-box protein [Betaproteobacteria bacterium]